MKKEKIDKYMKGHFTLTNKNMIAYEKLNQIKDYLVKQIGGSNNQSITKTSNNKSITKTNNSQIEYFHKSRNELNRKINSLSAFVDNKEATELIVKIKEEAENKNVHINDQVFGELVNADKQLLNSFSEFNNIVDGLEGLDQSNDGVEGSGNLKQELLSIQQGLFKLQVKIIFSKLKQIKTECEIKGVNPVNVTKLFYAIRKKVDAMNYFIDQKTGNEEKSGFMVNNQMNSDGISKGDVVEPSNSRDVVEPSNSRDVKPYNTNNIKEEKELQLLERKQLIEEENLREEQRLKEEQLKEEEKLEEQDLKEKQLKEQEELEAQKLEAQKLEAQKLEAQNFKEVQKLEVQKLEAQKLEEQKLEAQKLEERKLEERKLEEQK